jgi:hypothetical protein
MHFHCATTHFSGRDCGNRPWSLLWVFQKLPFSLGKGLENWEMSYGKAILCLCYMLVSPPARFWHARTKANMNDEGGSRDEWHGVGGVGGWGHYCNGTYNRYYSISDGKACIKHQGVTSKFGWPIAFHPFSRSIMVILLDYKREAPDPGMSS